MYNQNYSQNTNNNSFIWGEFNINFSIVQDKLRIYVKNNNNRKVFIGVYEFQKLSTQIQNTYGSLDVFLDDLLFIIEEKNHDRLKIRQNGEVIFSIQTKIAGKLRLVQEVLRTEEQKVEQLKPQQQMLRCVKEFEIFKCDKNRQFDDLEKRISNLQGLEKRIQKLEKGNRSQRVLTSNREFLKQSNLTSQNRMQENINEMKSEQTTIDGYYCTFLLKNNCLFIELLDKENAQKYEIFITQNCVKNSSIKKPELLFQEIAYIIENHIISQRISITKQATLIIKFYQIFQGKQNEIIQKFKAEFVQMNQIQKLKTMLKLAKKQYEPAVTFLNTAQNVINEQKEWIIKQLNEHKLNLEKNSQEAIGKIKANLKQTKYQILGIEHYQSQKMEKQSVKPISLSILQNLILSQKEELNSFANSFAQQIRQIKIQNDVVSKKEIKQQNFRIAYKLSNILQTDKQCEILFKFFSKKVDHIRLMFKASQHNFSAVKFHQICDNVPHTLVLIKTQFDKIIGGYTPIKWNKNIDNYTQDPSLTSFIFSLTNGDKFIDSNTGQSILNGTSYGPTFGGGNDLYISNQSNLNNCCSQHCKSYQNSNYTYNNQQSWTKFQGSKLNQYFKTLQYEVYQVVFAQIINKQGQTQ